MAERISNDEQDVMATEYEEDKIEQIMQFLLGTWHVEQLETEIQHLYPYANLDILRSVAHRIARYHIDSEGYTRHQIRRQLARL